MPGFSLPLSGKGEGADVALGLVQILELSQDAWVLPPHSHPHFQWVKTQVALRCRAQPIMGEEE